MKKNYILKVFEMKLKTENIISLNLAWLMVGTERRLVDEIIRQNILFQNRIFVSN